MARHARVVDRRTRVAALTAVAVTWIGGLAAGFYTLLALGSRYGCTSNNHGLGCGNGGTGLGVLLLLVVIATVTAVTVLASDAPTRRAALVASAGIAVLVACFLGARAILDTI